MRPIITIILSSALCMILSFAGCDTDPIHDDPPPPYDEYGKGDTARVLEGQEFEIVLYNGYAGAGFGWYVIKEFDHDLVEFVQKYSEIVSPDLLGSPVYEHWRYRAASPGTTAARYKLYRLWLGDESSIDSAHVTVIVQ